MKRRLVSLAAFVATSTWAIACFLNPQPFPPESDVNGFVDAGPSSVGMGSNGEDAGISLHADASVADASVPVVRGADGAASADATADASTPRLDASDAAPSNEDAADGGTSGLPDAPPDADSGWTDAPDRGKDAGDAGHAGDAGDADAGDTGDAGDAGDADAGEADARSPTDAGPTEDARTDADADAGDSAGTDE